MHVQRLHDDRIERIGIEFVFVDFAFAGLCTLSIELAVVENIFLLLFVDVVKFYGALLAFCFPMVPGSSKGECATDKASLKKQTACLCARSGTQSRAQGFKSSWLSETLIRMDAFLRGDKGGTPRYTNQKHGSGSAHSGFADLLPSEITLYFSTIGR